MTQDDLWQNKYNEVIAFIETNKRNPSKHVPEERGRYVNWIKHNRKQLNAGSMKPTRIEPFKHLLELIEENKRKNQYE